MNKKTFLILLTFCTLNHSYCQTVQALLDQVKVNLNKGNNPEVLSTCSQILSNDANNELARLYRAEALMNVMQFDSSLKDIEKVIKLNSKNGKAYNLKGKIKLRLYDFKIKSNCDDAKQNFDIALQLNPNDFTAINNIAYYYQYCIGDIKSSIEQYNKSLAINENQPNIYYSRGNLKGDSYDTVGALNDYTSAIKLNSNYGAYFVERAKIYQSRGDYKKSFEDYNKAMIADSSAIAFIGRGVSAFYLQKYDIAIIDFTHVIDKTLAAELENHTSLFSYNCPAAYYYRGYCYYYTKQINKSCNDWNNAIKRGVSEAKELTSTYCKLDPITYLNRAHAKYDEGDYSGALENINTYLGINPKSEEAINIRANCKYMLKDYLGAIDDYKTCIGFNANNIDAVFYQASSYNELGNYNDAIESYNMCININQKYTEAYYYRGTCYENLKDYKNALIDYNKVLALNPKMFENEIYFKRAMVKSSLSDDKGAILDYKKASIYDPKNAAIYANSGQLKFDLKDFKGALNDYNMALILEPTFGYVYYYRGLTNIELGNNKTACEDLKIASEAGVELAGIKLTETCK